jgi:hypothetical protein
MTPMQLDIFGHQKASHQAQREPVDTASDGASMTSPKGPGAA